MGSQARVKAFVDASHPPGFKGRFEFVPCCTQFSFAANFQASTCYEKLVIHFLTEPPSETEVDTLEEGSVPILVSLQQMQNLYTEFRHTPDYDYITCIAVVL